MIFVLYWSMRMDTLQNVKSTAWVYVLQKEIRAFNFLSYLKKLLFFFKHLISLMELFVNMFLSNPKSYSSTGKCLTYLGIVKRKASWKKKSLNIQFVKNTLRHFFVWDCKSTLLWILSCYPISLIYIFFYSIEKEGTVSLKIRPKIEKFVSFYILENMYVKSTGTCNMCTFILFPEVNDEFNNMSYSLDLVKMMKKSSTKLIYLMWNCIVKLKFHSKDINFLLKKTTENDVFLSFTKNAGKSPFFMMLQLLLWKSDAIHRFFIFEYDFKTGQNMKNCTFYWNKIFFLLFLCLCKGVMDK